MEQKAPRENRYYTRWSKQAAIDERQEHKERSMLKDLKERRKKRLVGLLKRCKRDLDEAQARASATERKLDRVLGEHIHACEKDMEAPGTTSWTRCGR